MKNNKIILAILAVTALVGNSALAATATGTMQVNTSVAATCQLTTEPITFFSPITETPGLISTNKSSAPIKLTCTKGTAYTIALNGGSSGSIAARSMSGAKTGNTDKLKYNIYKDQANTIVMGDTGAALVSGTGTGVEIATTLYTAIAGNQYSTPDTYSDNLTVTVTY